VIVTGVPAVVALGGADEALIPVQGEVVSVYWKALNASYVFGGVPPLPGLLASRAQTEKRYEPVGLPLVTQVKVLLVEYA
jgi:hypothetical protein